MAGKKKKPADYGPVEAARHREDALEINKRGVLVRNIKNCPVDYFNHKGWLSEGQYEAACTLRRDFHDAGYPSVGVANLQAVGGRGSDNDKMERSIDAGRQYQTAIRTLEPLGRSLVFFVVIAEQWPKDFEEYYKGETGKPLPWPARNAMGRLKEALDVIFDFYADDLPVAD